jgi:hypothetical protein
VSLIEDTGQASRLVACGLRPKLRPIEDPDYLDLVRRYRQQDSFARSVRAVANGMGLDVLDVTEAAGIVLGAHRRRIRDRRRGSRGAEGQGGIRQRRQRGQDAARRNRAVTITSLVW